MEPDPPKTTVSSVLSLTAMLLLLGIAATSLLSRIALAFAGAFLLPALLYVWIRERIAERRTLADLRRLADVDARFDWRHVSERMRECFQRVHTAWSHETMAEAAPVTTSWFWQNQQLTCLDRWRDRGLRNVSRIASIGRVRPLHVSCRNVAEDLSGSRIVVAVRAKMQDYFVSRGSGEIVQGDPQLQEVESVWTLLHADGCWRVAGIEEDTMTLWYAHLANEVPDLLPDRKGTVTSA